MQLEKNQIESNNTIQSLKNLLTDILLTNKTYDCMPINSLISSIDKQISFFDAINILISESADELLVWDEQGTKWVWMLTLVDTTRFIIHALRSYVKTGKIQFTDFGNRDTLANSELPVCSMQVIEKVVSILQVKKISQILKQMSVEDKGYIRLKTVSKQSKLSFVVLTMIVQRIHRILVQDPQSKMIISVLNFKDILLYLLRIANESNFEVYTKIQIQTLLQNINSKHIVIHENEPIWKAFDIMMDQERSLWINVVDQNEKFKGMIFRDDFRDILLSWRLDYLWMKTVDFLKVKEESYHGSIPQFRHFKGTDITKDILWKIVMTRRNALIWLDNQGHIKSTIGLMQLFNLYVH